MKKHAQTSRFAKERKTYRKKGRPVRQMTLCRSRATDKIRYDEHGLALDGDGSRGTAGREMRLTSFLRQFCTVFVKCIEYSMFSDPSNIQTAP